MAIEIDPIDYAWLNLTDEDIKALANTDSKLFHDKNNPGMNELRMMKHSDYFFFTCKTLLNIELLPIQLAILEELWTRPFPMYIASRGFGKMLSGNELIRNKNGWKLMKDVCVGDKVYGGDGKLCNVIAKTDLQKNLNMYRITLRDGRTIDCCEDHQWKIWDKNKNRNKKEPVYSVVKTKDIINDYYYDRIGEKSSGKEYKYALPINQPLIEEESSNLLLHPYVVGVLLGDGCLRNSSIRVTSLDKELLDRFESLLPKGYFLTSLNNGKDYSVSRRNKDIPAFVELCRKIGIYGHTAHDKFIPEDYKYSSYEQKLELIKGLNDTDGYSKRTVIEYYTVAKKLAEDYIDVARSLGLHCKKSSKEAWIKDKRYADCHMITTYTDKPVFALSRKLEYLTHNRSKQGQSKFDKVFITKIEKIENGDGYCIMVDSPDHTYITKDYIVTHNSYLLAVFCWLKMILVPNTKVVVVGAAFRQSKIIFDYMNSIWNNAPILQSIAGDNSGPRVGVDKVTMSFNNSWTIAIPIGDGSTIRGLRAHVIIGDEFASISPDIYETVIQGFTSVSPNPLQNVQVESRKRKMKDLGLWTQEYENIIGAAKVNQSIVSGTADYAFKHFAQYWKRYHTIVTSGGDREKLREVFPEEVPNGFDWRDFSIIRIPYDLVPKGFMDEKQIAKAKATIHSGTFNNEYGAIFSEDSDGFFKRSLIESCVVSDKNPINGITFEPKTVGDQGYQYVFGIDPASEADNFTIVIIELHSNHNRVVYCWSTNRKEFKKRLIAGRAKEHDFYGFCARKIRNLMKAFPCVKLGLDAQGGGVAIEEALQDPDKIHPHEHPIYRVVNLDKPYYTDTLMGSHILELIQFANYEWTYNANNNLKKDMEEKFILFPELNPVLLAIEAGKNELSENFLEYDSFEDCSLEIEELKNELCTIVHSVTGTGQGGRERWDTPEIKLEGNKKGRQRKDRYSALLIANSLARQIHRAIAPATFEIVGDYRQNIESSFKNQQMYNGTDIWRNITEDCFIGVQRNVR